MPDDESAPIVPAPDGPEGRTTVYQWRQAAARVLTLAPGLIPLGLLFGAAAVGAGFDAAQATAMSATVFAGAAQFATVALHQEGAGWATIVGVVLIINSRYFLMTAAVLELARPERPSRWRRVLLSLLVVDESFALQSSWAASGGARLAGLIAIPVLLWVTWVGSTLAGGLVGAHLPPFEPWGLDYALPGLFIGLFGIFANTREKAAIGLLAIALASVAALAGLGLHAVVLVPPILALAAGRWRRVLV